MATLSPYYECQEENVYIRSDRRKSHHQNVENIKTICDQLKTGGPLALMCDGLMIESGVYAVNFNTHIVMCIYDNSCIFFCYLCQKALQYHKFYPLDEIEPDILKCCILNVPHTYCDTHGYARIRICPHCRANDPADNWYNEGEGGVLSRCVQFTPHWWLTYYDEEEEEVVKEFNDDSAINLLHSCWKNVLKIILKDQKISLIVYVSNNRIYRKCLKCQACVVMAKKDDNPLHCGNTCH